MNEPAAQDSETSSSVPLEPDASAWRVLAVESPQASALAQELSIAPPIARLLVCRGFDTAAAARSFLEPALSQLHNPLLLLGMETAVTRLHAALLGGEPILIYGDYDVDGTVATVLLKTAIERAALALGVTTDVRYHIPHRMREGYGMQDVRIAQAAAEGVRLVISVDTGIRAFAAADEARRCGLDLIVTDHHLPDSLGVPDAVAVVNPNQPGCGQPYKELCGAAVAYKVAEALLDRTLVTAQDRERLRSKLLPSFLKLLAIATIADAVPLTGENRTIAAIGLRELRNPAQPGLRALMELAQIDISRPISAMDIGFRLAPRINAAGRMDIASDVVAMFLERDPAVAVQLATKLNRLNDDRRATEAEALRAIEAETDALAASSAGLPFCLVLDDADEAAAGRQGWHRGVIGILAARVVDRTGRPALVLTHADGIAYGSGRSTGGFHLLDALAAAHAADSDGLFTRFGGHAHAVGFSLPSSSVPALRQRMQQGAAQNHSVRDDATPGSIICDVELRLGEITADLLTSLEALGPFGMGNTEPVFVTRGVRLAAAVKVVKERHLRLLVEDADDGTRFGGMVWSRRTDWAAMALRQGWQQGQPLDVAYRLHRNWHRDFGGWELDIVALREVQTG